LNVAPRSDVADPCILEQIVQITDRGVLLVDANLVILADLTQVGLQDDTRHDTDRPEKPEP